jgi:hypothetical protein
MAGTDKDAMNVFFTPGSLPPSALSARESEMDCPFVVRYCGKHHELVNALVDYLGEFIQTAEIGQNLRHEGCDSNETTSSWREGVQVRFKKLVDVVVLITHKIHRRH